FVLPPGDKITETGKVPTRSSLDEVVERLVFKHGIILPKVGITDFYYNVLTDELNIGFLTLNQPIIFLDGKEGSYELTPTTRSRVKEMRANLHKSYADSFGDRAEPETSLSSTDIPTYGPYRYAADRLTNMSILVVDVPLKGIGKEWKPSQLTLTQAEAERLI